MVTTASSMLIKQTNKQQQQQKWLTDFSELDRRDISDMGWTVSWYLEIRLF